MEQKRAGKVYLSYSQRRGKIDVFCDVCAESNQITEAFGFPILGSNTDGRVINDVALAHAASGGNELTEEFCFSMPHGYRDAIVGALF